MNNVVRVVRGLGVVMPTTLLAEMSDTVPIELEVPLDRPVAKTGCFMT